MRSIENKGSYNQGENSSGNAITFEFHKSNNGSNRTPHHRMALGKPTPSKWDDAQKWLVGLSRGGGGGGGGERCQNKPRNSNADDRRLIAPVPQQEEEYLSGEEDGVVEILKGCHPSMENHYEVETKKVDCDESVWRINKPTQNSATSAVRSICLRDMGTEMTPIASQEPSRTATPIRVRTPAARSPISSGSSTPARCQHKLQGGTDQGHQAGVPLNNEASSAAGGNGSTRHYVEESNGSKVNENGDLDQSGQLNSLEKRAIAWDEAERAKYMARFKREEVKIQAWENHEKRKAEMEMRKMEVKAERMKARAQEKLANKLAKTKRIAEEKRANAEAKLNEKAVQTSERADYIRRNGHLPSSFSFKLPSICW